jgi:glucose/arabinose dehydrogenase
MLGWRRNAGLMAAAAVLIAPACGRHQPPAPPAQAPAGLVQVDVQVPAALAQPPFNVTRHALVPPGWTISVWSRIPNARIAAWAPDGALLVSVPADRKVLRLTPDGNSPPRQSELLTDLDAPHGLAFAGATLYVAESDQLNAYTYKNGVASDRRVVAAGLPDDRSPELGGAYAHALKSVAVGPDGAVYFSIGSTGNITPEDRTATPERASVMRIPPGGGPFQVFARGVRNGTGLAVAPDGSLWSAVNNRDNIADPNNGPTYGQVVPAYVDDHPPESFAKLTPGRDLGWPYCHPDTDGANPPFARDAQTNGDGTKLDCGALPRVEQTFGAHAAPLGLSFVDGGLPPPYASGALVGVHGSWNREPPRAPEVSFFPWRNGSLGNQQTLVGGFQGPDGSRWGRPVAAVLGPDGAVYITDDYAGAVYRLAPPGR